jgi:ADP-ribose pyrophosphatase YjhB (NUDIX family)
MWAGGVRVIIEDNEGRLLLVCQEHEGRKIWMLPGGAIEENENSMEAARREVLEETGFEVDVGPLLWHVEEVSKSRGQRFVNYFMASIEGGSYGLGRDPEFDDDGQVLRETRFISPDEMKDIEHLYPSFLKEEIWDLLDRHKKPGCEIQQIYRIRDKFSV